ncbi:MAG: polymer-forming cytoskeletal protein [Deltaproteobacteria bacterium]|nr:polymer-forming cytoskeletal protein [Deltaproteobacteria bacterium]
MANIGKSISIRGDLTGNEDMVIEGQVEGKVDLPNNQLTVGADGKVKAEIHAKSVVVVGRVDGNIFGLERIEIQATGRVEGDVTAPKLVVAEGAQLNGAIKMSQQGNRAESAKPEKATAATSPEVRKAG